MAIELKLNQMLVNDDGTFSPIIAAGPQGQQGQQGAQGNPGSPGANGVSPTISITTITGGHRVTITDVNGTQSFDVMDGEDGGSSVTVDSALSSTSENPVQNKVVKAALDGKITSPSSPASGAFLVWNGSAWTAQTLSTWQGGSY